MTRRRYSLSREDIGILMSFAKHPEAMTTEWIHAIRVGVSEDELHELFRIAGLPPSSARQIVGAGLDEESTDSPAARGTGFRRAMIGTVLMLTLLNVVALVGARGITVASVSILIAFVAAGVIMVKVLDRLSPGLG